MKKNYNCPKTEEVLLTTATSILQLPVGSPTTEPDPMHNPGGDSWLAPKRQV